MIFKFKTVIHYTCMNALLDYLCDTSTHLVVFWYRCIKYSRYFCEELVKPSKINYVSGDKDGDVVC
jgi:hypothetical protein